MLLPSPLYSRQNSIVRSWVPSMMLGEAASQLSSQIINKHPSSNHYDLCAANHYDLCAAETVA